MELIELFRIIILILDLKDIKLGTYTDYEDFRQELGVNINTCLSGPRAGNWIGGRVKKKRIYLFFRVSDPTKAKKCILKLIDNYTILNSAKIRIKEKSIRWKNHAFI
jgi:methylglyoxal synthase